MSWLVSRLKEPSTWRGIIWLATALGVSLKPEVWEQITVVGMAVAGLLGVLAREEPKAVEAELPPIDLIARADGTYDRVQPAAVPPNDPIQSSTSNANDNNGDGWGDR